MFEIKYVVDYACTTPFIFFRNYKFKIALANRTPFNIDKHKTSVRQLFKLTGGVLCAFRFYMFVSTHFLYSRNKLRINMQLHKKDYAVVSIVNVGIYRVQEDLAALRRKELLQVSKRARLDHCSACIGRAVARKIGSRDNDCENTNTFGKIRVLDELTNHCVGCSHNSSK
jgi:hypothetical protein